MNELRLGNLVDYEKTTHYVCGLADGKIYSWWFKDGQPIIEKEPKDVSGILVDSPYIDFPANYDPIPLTSKRLEQCGYKITKAEWEDGFYAFRNPITFYLENDIVIRANVRSPAEVECKYLHQLQNLHFAHTGEELKFNPVMSKSE